MRKKKRFDHSIRTLLAVFVYICLAYILIVVRSMIRKQYQEPQLSRKYVTQKATNVHCGIVCKSFDRTCQISEQRAYGEL